MADQLEKLPACRRPIRRDIEDAWREELAPARAQQLAAPKAAGPALLAEALSSYWTVAVEPYCGTCAPYSTTTSPSGPPRTDQKRPARGARRPASADQCPGRGDPHRQAAQLAAGPVLRRAPTGAVRVHLAECDLRGGLAGTVGARPTPRAVSAADLGASDTQAPDDDAWALLGSSRAAICLELPHPPRSCRSSRPEPAVDQPASVGAAPQRSGDVARPGRSVLYRGPPWPAASSRPAVPRRRRGSRAVSPTLRPVPRRSEPPWTSTV